MIVAVPVVPDVQLPDGSMVATVADDEDQRPPGQPSLRFALLAGQSAVVPVIAGAPANTLIAFFTAQPLTE